MSGEAPSGVGAFANAPGMITVSWAHTGEGVHWYVIEQEDPFTFWAADIGKRVWSVSGLTPSRTYRYRICAVFDFDRSCSDWVSVTTMPPVSPPPPPPPPEQAARQLAANIGAFESINFPGHLIRHRDFAGFLSPVSSDLDRADATFHVRPGLAGVRDSVSLEASNLPGHFLRHQDFRLKLHRNDGSDLFRADASFVPSRRGNFCHTRLESVNLPGHFLRHANFELSIGPDDGSELFRNDSTWRRIPPPPKTAPPGSLSFHSVNFPGRYIRHRNALGEISPIASDLDRSDSTFILRQALVGRGEVETQPVDANEIAVSLESVNFPGHFLRHQDFRLKLHQNDGSLLFRRDASFFYQDGGCSDGTCPASFESVNLNAHFIRHSNFELFVHERDGTDLFNQDATWQPTAPFRQ